MSRRITIEDAHKLARDRGGLCLSDCYINSKTKLTWKCGECGNIWNALYDSVRRGTWCKPCGRKRAGKINAVKRRVRNIAGCNLIAKEHGWKCLSQNYVSVHEKLSWFCNTCGTKWEGTLGNILYNKCGCPECSRRERLAYTIDDCINIAHGFDGKCLSSVYVNNTSPMVWKCKNGHKFTSSIRRINNGSWCPVCYPVSYPEGKFREEIQKVTGHEFPTIRPNWLKNSRGNRLEIDGFNRELMTGFEYQGKQHFFYVSHYHNSVEEFEQQVKDDATKSSILKKRGIFMLYPDYTIDPTEFNSYILSNIKGCNYG